MCAEDQDNWDDYVEQVLGTYRGVPNLTTGESPFFLVYGRDGNQPLHQLLQPLTRATGKIRSCNVKDVVLEPISVLWNVNPEFGKGSKFINHPNNLPDFTPDTR